ncbi:MAG: hypothetical protein HY531_03610 [Chloroflexi bacterium]|nr:hypothetical protein [Chloroflexota bacterium]
MRMRRVWQSISLGLLVAVFLVSGVAGVTEQGRAMVKALLFIPQILPSVPVRPQEWLVTAPTHQEVRFPVGGAEAVADLYLPADGGRHPAVVLFLGVVPAGRDDPRVVDLARGLARSSMAVMIPWSNVMITSRRLDPEAVDLLVGAFQYMEKNPAVDPRRIGMGGFCVGASFATLAAEDPRIRERVAYVNSFGGWYDARDLLVAIASRTRSYGEEAQPWMPREDTREVFAVHLIEGLPNLSEREALSRVFLKGGPAEEVSPALLSEQGRTVYRLLSGVTVEEARSLLNSLPAGFRSELERMSPSTGIGGLKAPVLIMHDREDAAVAAEESRRLAEALEGRGRVHYTEFSLFQHVDPTRPLAPPEMARESWKLLMHMYNIMRLGA